MDLLHTLGIDLKGLITTIIGFVLLVVILRQLLYKPIFSAIDQRQSDIAQVYDQLDADRAAMDKSRKEYEDRLAGIETHARERIQSAVKEAQELAAAVTADAHLQAQAIVEKARTDAERERQRVYIEMRQQIVDLAIGAAGKVVGDSMDAPRQQRLVEEFIGSIGAPSPSPNGASAAA